MSSEISFTVWGEPVAQGRARAAIIGGHVRLYDPAKSRSYKQWVYDEAVKVRPPAPLEGPISLTVLVYRSIPKGFSKAKRLAAMCGRIRPTTKPDLKNILAGVEDALKGIIWRDDSQVVDFGESGKWYSEAPRVEIRIRPAAAEDLAG